MKKKPNLARMYIGLLEVYWLESFCTRRSADGRKCCDVGTREARLCESCAGFVRLKESMRLALGEDHERRGGDPHLNDVVH